MYSVSNISAKNYQDPLICIEVIVCYISVVFRHIVDVQNLTLVFRIQASNM